MPRRVVRTEQTEQPQVNLQINWGNPITRGLIALIDGASGLELVTSTVPTFSNGTRSTGSNGQSVGYTTSQYATYGFANRSRLTNQLTMFSLTDYTAGGSPNGFLFGDTQSAGAGYNFGLYGNGVAWNAFVKTGGSGASATGGTFGQRSRFAHSATYDGANIRQYLDGVAAGVTAKTGNVDTGSFSLNINRWNSGNLHAGRFYIGGVWNRALSVAEIASLSANPWQLFEPQMRSIPLPSGVTVYYPASDIVVNSWTPSTGSDLFAMVDDPTLNRADFITSPNLTSPVTMGWGSSLAAGTYDVSVDFDRTGATGQLRIVLLDSGGTAVGTSSWQAAPSSAATTVFSVTTTGTSDRFRIEVQA